MKTIKTKSRFFGMMLLAVVMFCAAGCTKPDDNENGGNDGNGGNGGNGGGGGNSNGGVELVGTYNGHEYVDLGLPSGTKWATCNVGSSTPEGYGDYFAWGETSIKTKYNLENYRYMYTDNSGNYLYVTKYNTNSEYGAVDNLTVLQPGDDAATAQWGSGWQIPTKAQWEELILNTTNIWTTKNGVNGRLFTSSNGGSLFLPAAGCHHGNGVHDTPYHGYYWSSSLYTDDSEYAWEFYFNSNSYMVKYFFRIEGFPVRAVH